MQYVQKVYNMSHVYLKRWPADDLIPLKITSKALTNHYLWRKVGYKVEEV